jgi:seryl-tRNA synthetase
MNLYEINEAIMDCVDEETGEIIDTEKLEELQLARDEKIEGIGCYIKNLLSDAEQLKVEKDKLAERQKSCENKAKRLKEYLETFLSGEKFKSPKLAISYRKTESVDVPDWRMIPEEYLRTKDPEPDKTAIKKAIKAGEEIPGCGLVVKQSMMIK